MTVPDRLCARFVSHAWSRPDSERIVSHRMSPPPEDEPHPSHTGAPRRTILAAERTQLAWWRTAFAVLAVGLAIGKIIPQLANEETIWPYTALGAAFGIYAVLLTIHGSRRRERVEHAVRTGESIGTSRAVQGLLTGGATALALATTAMIIFN